MINLIILPVTLFNINIIKNYNIKKIYIIEEPRYFTDYKFHKLKLAYHRATMKYYFDYLSKEYSEIKYIEYHDTKKINELYKKNNNLYVFNPIDHNLINKFKSFDINILDTHNFLLSEKDIHENKHIFFKNNKYYQDLFYKFQRTRLNILIEKNNNNIVPTGGKWSYDNLNRKKLDLNIKIPNYKLSNSIYFTEAETYVNTNFPDNYGEINYLYPITHDDTLKHLKFFLKNKLNYFGPYQDSSINDNDKVFLFHSVLSPMMNIGLITDKEVISLSNKYYEKNKKYILLNSYEGFIRQVIGWRNYVYSIYILEPNLYHMNYMNHKNKIDESWWLGNTTLPVIDNIIKNINKYAYCHHIERLMYLSNILLLLEKDPKEVHRIFMEWTVDSYDWVMTPNVMGMGQYADGGKMMTRIYFSSSNYILKMSNYKRGEWSQLWDDLYYNFIHNNYNLLKKNYATSRQVSHWNKKSQKEKDDIISRAQKFITK